MGEHARLSPSAGDRWMNCPGSVAAEAAEKDEQNKFGAEGTVAHKVFEYSLKYGLEPHDFLGQHFMEAGFKIIVDEAMCEHLLPIIDEIRDMPGKHFYENRVKLDRWLPGQFGTLDVGIVDFRKFIITIRDLKYGAGLPVRAEKNTQLRIYAAGFWDDYVKALWPDNAPLPLFRILIDQPRHEAGGGEEIISYDELMAFMRTVKEAGSKTYDAKAPRIAGDKQCGWCKAAQNGHCRENDEWQLNKAKLKLQQFQGRTHKQPELPPVESLDPEHRARILDMAPALTQWLKRLHAAHINECLAGGDGGGKKVVEGRLGNRRWKDEEAALAWMEKTLPEHADLYQPEKIITPAAAQKFLGKGGKEKLKPHVEQPPGKPVLVPITDPRKPVASYKERFTEYDEEEEG